MNRNTIVSLLAIAGVLISVHSKNSHAVDTGAENAVPTNIKGIWANDGGDKIRREETRAITDPKSVVNSVWTGNKIKIFGARNEVVNFNVILEAGTNAANNVSVKFEKLSSSTLGTITGKPVTGNGVFDWTNRNIELFFVKYLQIKGLSNLSYEHNYDERHIPSAMRRPLDPNDPTKGIGKWTDRPGADKYFPDIAVPYELVKTFKIDENSNQSIWTDIYIPRFAKAGTYKGKFIVSENAKVVREIPVELNVRNFTLPEVPAAKSMLYIGYQDMNERYTGKTAPKSGTVTEQTARAVRDKHFLLAHRHKISLIDQDMGALSWEQDSPREEWVSRLDGSLFTPMNNYDGPGVYTSNGVYSIGTYGAWSWKRDDEESSMHAHTNNWMRWFTKNFPDVETFLYLQDESQDFAKTERLASWIKSNKGIGKNLKSFATLPLPDAVKHSPSLDIAASWFSAVDRDTWQSAYDNFRADQSKRIFMYNGKRPASGSFATEDDGTALRELVWGQYKLGIDRWFFWEGTYYNDFQAGGGPTNVFKQAQTIGSYSRNDTVNGQVGYLYSNGDGVLFYPGTDKVYPDESYGIQGPIASLRLKHWRRGIQDVDYISMAAKIDPARTKEIVNGMVPKVLWENGVTDPNDPTWVKTDISWPVSSEAWEAARLQLAEIIDPRPITATPVKGTSP